MKNELKRMLAGFLAALMLLTAAPAVKADFSVNACAVELTDASVEDDILILAADEAEEAEEAEEADTPIVGNRAFTTIINFFKDFAAIIRAALDFLRKYDLIDSKK